MVCVCVFIESEDYKMFFFSNMSCPFVDDPVDEKAVLLHREFTSGDDIESRLDVFSFPHNRFERYFLIHSPLDM